MSLRAELRAAIDDVTPPAPGLIYKVAASLEVADGHGTVLLRRRSFPRPASCKGMASLVAAALVVVFMAGLVVWGRLWRGSYNPRGYKHPLKQLQLKKIEAPPPQPPPVAARAQWPGGPLHE